MKFFDYTNTQIINYDAYSGYSAQFTNISMFPLIYFFCSKQSIFNFTFFKFFWKRMLNIISLISKSKGIIGLIADFREFNSMLSFLKKLKTNLLVLKTSDWVPGTLVNSLTWKKFPSFCLNFIQGLGRSFWVESARSGLPVFNIIDSNSQIFESSVIFSGNSINMNSFFFYYSLIYKTMMKSILISKFNFNLNLLKFYLISMKSYQSLFFNQFTKFLVIQNWEICIFKLSKILKFKLLFFTNKLKFFNYYLNYYFYLMFNYIFNMLNLNNMFFLNKLKKMYYDKTIINLSTITWPFSMSKRGFFFFIKLMKFMKLKSKLKLILFSKLIFKISKHNKFIMLKLNKNKKKKNLFVNFNMKKLMK